MRVLQPDDEAAPRKNVAASTDFDGFVVVGVEWLQTDVARGGRDAASKECPAACGWLGAVHCETEVDGTVGDGSFVLSHPSLQTLVTRA